MADGLEEPAALDLVTVFCRRDLGRMALQARSIALYFDRSALGQVIFVCNEPSGAVSPDELERIADELPGVVFIQAENFLPRRAGALVSAAQLAQIPYSTEGWFTQQVIKIAISRLVRSRFYLILDAKNHFVRPVSKGVFVAGDGRALAAIGPLSRIRPDFHPMWRNCFAYFGLDPELHADEAIRPVTPFVVRKDLAGGLIEHVEARESAPFADVLLARMPQLFEFFLIQAFAAYRHGALGGAYANSPPCFETIFHPTVGNADAFNAAMERAEGDGIVAFALHWAAELLMSPEQRRRVADYWQRRGLVASPQEAERLMGWK